MSDRKLPKTGSKAPNPIDVAVGTKIKVRRRLQGIGQEELGAAIGVTFQQVQKYEKGTNRVSASRLHQIADVLGMSVSEFFPKPAGEMTRHPGVGIDDLAEFIETNEAAN